MRGPASKEKMDANQIRMAIKQALGKLQLSPTPHWVKILYSQKDSKPLTVAATLDNQDQNELTNAVKEMQWPRRDGYYTAKQFVVIK